MTQSFENHVKFVPAFHFVVLPIFAINLVSSIFRVWRDFSAHAVISLLVAVALILLAFCARIFALTVQDRVIRLEMQLRLHSLLPPDLCGRIPELTVSQLVSLRFASDSEMAELARKVLADNLTDRKTIKKLVRNWQADNLRA
jgi:Family of unknown function (DUF6526)